MAATADTPETRYMPDGEAQPNPTRRGTIERMNLPLTAQATKLIKDKARMYKGQTTQADFVIRLAKKVEAESLAGLLTDVIEELEMERRIKLGLHDAVRIEPVELTVQGD